MISSLESKAVGLFLVLTTTYSNNSTCHLYGCRIYCNRIHLCIKFNWARTTTVRNLSNGASWEGRQQTDQKARDGRREALQHGP